MAEDRYYLTTGKNPNGKGLLAIISLGSTQLGDENVTVCDLEVVKNMKEAKAWFKRAMAERLWEPRN